MSVRVEERARQIAAGLAADLRRCALGLTKDPGRDLEDVVSQLDGRFVFIAGVGEAKARLYLALEFSSEEEVWISLRVTKGSVGVEQAEWGATGPEVGNTPLFARVVHVVLRTLQQLGIRRVKNQPATQRLREKYKDLGFVDDSESGPQTLDLADERALERALVTVRSAYEAYGIAFNDPP